MRRHTFEVHIPGYGWYVRFIMAEDVEQAEDLAMQDMSVKFGDHAYSDKASYNLTKVGW